MKPLQILALSGSLRAASSNTAILRAAAALAGENAAVALFERLSDLPHFDPDIDDNAAPAVVVEFRRQLQACNGVLISSPEYAHGVPGVLKNALDWLVGSGELVEKPVAVITAKRATWAHASLTETLSVMTAKLVPGASIVLPLPTNRIDAAGILSNPELEPILRIAIRIFVESIRANSAATSSQ